MLKPAFHEMRQFGRRQTSCHGWVKVRGRPAVACVVRNISEGGALLEFQAAEMLPYRFAVEIESERINCECEVRHQTGNRVGVEFVKAPRRTGPEPATANEVRPWMSRR